MHLDDVQYVDEDSLNRLLSCCPVLDDLVIKRSNFDKVWCLIIRIPSLKSLTLHLCSIGLHDEDFYAHNLQIDTPTLQDLNLEDEFIYLLDAENLSSLVRAKIKVTLFDESALDVDSYARISNFLRSLSKVKFLSIFKSRTGGNFVIFGCLAINTLFWQTFRAASANISPCFHNLTVLELELYDCLDLDFITNNFLENKDNLEHLVMKGCIDSCSHQSWWSEPLNVANCLLSRIATISFSCMIADCFDQLELLRYFLKNAKVLQLMRISKGLKSEKEQLEFFKEISMVPWGSQTCQVELHSGSPFSSYLIWSTSGSKHYVLALSLMVYYE